MNRFVTFRILSKMFSDLTLTPSPLNKNGGALPCGKETPAGKFIEQHFEKWCRPTYGQFGALL